MPKFRRSKTENLFLPPAATDDLCHLLQAGSGKAGFETRRDARREDSLRSALLRSYARGCRFAASSAVSPILSQQALDLADRVASNQGLVMKSPTFASAKWMRRHRRHFCGAVFKAFFFYYWSKTEIFTLVPNRGWLIPRGDLSQIQPRRLLKTFRQQLVRTGLPCKDGWIIANLHGEYSAEADAYQLHVHLLAIGDAISIVDALRQLPMYRPCHDKSIGSVQRPVVRLHLADPARQISYYLAQAFWPLKPIFMRNGKLHRARRRHRLPPPCLVEFLMWIDRQDFRDLVLLYGCRITGGRLCPSSRSN